MLEQSVLALGAVGSVIVAGAANAIAGAATFDFSNWAIGPKT
jgi:hypothetical protein